MTGNNHRDVRGVGVAGRWGILPPWTRREEQRQDTPVPNQEGTREPKCLSLNKPGEMTQARVSLLGACTVAEEVRMARWQLGPRRRLPVTLSRPVILSPSLRSEGTLEAKLSLGVQSHPVP